MRNLRALQNSQRGMDIQILETLVRSFTIQEKLAFSPYLSKIRLRNKLNDLRYRQVPERNVLLNMSDADVTFYWLRNFIHPDLSHWVYKSPTDKRGCSKRILERDMAIDRMRTFENSQHYYNYTMADIEEYLNEESTEDATTERTDSE